MDKITLEKSLFYKGGQMEEIFFYVHHEGKKFALGNGQDTYGRMRDNYNLYNIVSEINEASQEAYETFDATVFSTSAKAMQKITEYVEKTPYDYDEKKTTSELEEFVKTEKLLQNSWNYDICLSCIKDVSTIAIENIPEDTKQHSLEYIREVIDETITPTGKNITSINGRRGFTDRLFGRNGISDFYEGFFNNLSYTIGRLKDTPYMDNVSNLFEKGFPSVVDIKEQKTVNEEERLKIRADFPHQREDALRTAVMNKYAIERINGALQLKYYDETKDLSIFLTEKEQEQFNAMNFSDLNEKYGTELVTTHKGAVLATLKLHQEKQEGKPLGESLKLYKGLISEAKQEANFDMNIRRYIFDEIKKDYQKFAPNDMEYRAIAEELAPSKLEIASINEYLEIMKENERHFPQNMVDRLNKIKKMQLQFTYDSAPIITGKANQSDIEKAKARITGKKKEETVSQAIKRVKLKHKEDRKTGENISGVVIADDIAERLKDGFELPTSKEKREAIATNLRKKRAMKEK